MCARAPATRSRARTHAVRAPARRAQPLCGASRGPAAGPGCASGPRSGSLAVSQPEAAGRTKRPHRSTEMRCRRSPRFAADPWRFPTSLPGRGKAEEAGSERSGLARLGAASSGIARARPPLGAPPQGAARHRRPPAWCGEQTAFTAEKEPLGDKWILSSVFMMATSATASPQILSRLRIAFSATQSSPK